MVNDKSCENDNNWVMLCQLCQLCDVSLKVIHKKKLAEWVMQISVFVVHILYIYIYVNTAELLHDSTVASTFQGSQGSFQPADSLQLDLDSRYH